MREIKQYQAFDGTTFTKKEDCQTYEWKFYKDVMKMMNKIKTVCLESDDCSECPFYYGGGQPDVTPCKFIDMTTSNFDDMPWFENPADWKIEEE